ncbi:MAG: ParB/RepB/Spo0J family partition protein, partial [Oscillospiraceae bacterium]|nr:ParB/RepB/Spo0J family partition protein [Oscillospiraceae bacterium]
MKTMFDNLNAIVANTLTDSIQMIDIDELHESKDNFFIVDRIEEFAETILGQGGVKDNLIVRPLENGGYEIISGHRRKVAVQYLLDNGKNISRYLPCLIQNYSDNDDKLLDIVLMNISSRQISDAEMWKSYEILERILQNKKDAGEKFGRTREKLAECLGVSPSQIGKMQNVERKAIPAVKEAIESGDISISTANEIARLHTEEQEKLMQQGDLSDIKYKDVKQMNKDTYVNLSENEIDEEQSDEDTMTEKVDTYVNFSENEIDEEQSDEDTMTEKVDAYINFSENEIDEEQSDEDTMTEKVDTYINFSENEIDEEQSDEDTMTEKVDT